MSPRVSIKDPYTEKRLYAARLVVVLLGVSALLLLLVWRYFSLQVLDHDIYRTQSDRNRVQLQAIPPKRGLIYDRNGVLLAENIPSYELTVVKEQVGDLEQTLATLQTIVELNDEHIEKFKQLLSRRRAYQAITLKTQLSEQEIAAIAVNRYRLPGVDVDARLSRYYPQGEYFAHVLGYVGRISEREQAVIDEVNYSGSQYIGKIGLEKYYEELLHGKVGYQNVETNARGRVLRVLERQDPEPGADIYLHLDAHVQKVAHDALAGERGAVVAIDPSNGGVIAMVSTPSFDPNLFVNGISNKDYSQLRDSLDLPLFNRALQGQYPPGSTVKPIFGLAGLHHKVVTPQTKVRDPGWYQLPNDDRLYRDWTWKTRRRGHGEHVQLEQAIAESCDTYFWDLAYQLGIDRMHDFAQPFGLGSKVEIDNTNERDGLLPSRTWKRQMKRLPWFPGETLNVGIGQGYMLVTPLQLASAFSAVANRGDNFVPRLLRQQAEQALPPVAKPYIEVQAQHWQSVIQAMAQVIDSRRGSAHSIRRGARFSMAGKTGTSQVIGIAQGAEYDAEQILKRQRDHALFVGFAPVDKPKIVVAVIIENGEKSSRAAAVVRKVFDAWLIDQDMLNKESSSPVFNVAATEVANES
ncbi:penicillin-binding protein 2 [Dasania sp. GY-MA-18]|uniref:Peptidoglycan D,D-transpeptidase MrdA n=1 Tax=Dasania phycosphaerae TaxID=2950436 RepID=A0A9J6RHF3_9GAMM|nr:MULTISPECIES: penicillin-binding protein 2 [Dasania]MCR8921211.1 penicillin-binding protein 2 [Dasania sp. GY-MA-18]MCZ0863639.1 penicillin-binding protein 2 [Dasania phycosphaerae]MCZ0867367.1 penicillin-binding protein 2 [Dasania phycosphaerae]